MRDGNGDHNNNNKTKYAKCRLTLNPVSVRETAFLPWSSSSAAAKATKARKTKTFMSSVRGISKTKVHTQDDPGCKWTSKPISHTNLSCGRCAICCARVKGASKTLVVYRKGVYSRHCL